MLNKDFSILQEKELVHTKEVEQTTSISVRCEITLRKFLEKKTQFIYFYIFNRKLKGKKSPLSQVVT
jgi:hypothetical protein